MRKPKFQSAITFVLLSALFINVFGFFAAAQTTQRDQPIVISFGQPNIWSLEQAHYLLARMHRQNLDLQTAELGDIDPNETNSQRINIVKSLLEAGFKYDEAIGINNQLRKSDKTLNSQAKPELFARRSARQSESIQLSRDIAALKIAKSKTTDADEKAALDAQIEAKTEQKAAVDEQITQTNSELQNLSTVSGDFQSVTADEGFDPKKLPTSVLDALIKDNLKDSKPSIAASQRLENHIQMQYEIIAKQLTLLRDEVGPGERLVFLELPQSINTSQDKAENKLAQVWWRISGYTKLNRNKLIETEIKKLEEEISAIRDKLDSKIRTRQIDAKNTEILKNQSETLEAQRSNLISSKVKLTQKIKELCDEKVKLEEKKVNLNKSAEKIKCDKEIAGLNIEIDKLNNQIADQEKANDETDNALKETQKAIQGNTVLPIKAQRETAKLSQSLSALIEKLDSIKLQSDRNNIRQVRDDTTRILQNGSQNTNEVVEETRTLLNTTSKNELPTYSDNVAENDAGRSFVSLETNATNSNKTLLKKQTIRTIDIIPRQNAVNVNDTRETVKATGIVAAFSFLFGFGGNVRYQRQRETFEQNLNQELYTSGFGKGNTDFGWNFYPFVGTKQISPGVRTTYAVAVIPEDAETIILKAKGCYFPRKDYQPSGYDAIQSWSEQKNEQKAGCSQQENLFILPVPGGGVDGADFYATEIRYSKNRSPKERMTASIYGRNFSPQTGILIDGVPLTEAVGLAQRNVESIISKKVEAVCEKDVCGRFERVDSTQIILSFTVPEGYRGTPRIELIAPGKGIELNRLNLNINGTEDTKLDDLKDMFGRPESNPPIAIDDFQVASSTTAVLTGAGFDKVEKFYLNGIESSCLNTTESPKSLCILTLPANLEDVITVTLAPKNEADGVISETFPNTFNLKINTTSILAFEPAGKTSPSVLTVKIEGSGFSGVIVPNLDATSLARGARIKNQIIPTGGQMILEISSPGPVVSITLRDPNTNHSVNTIIRVPPPETSTEDSSEKVKN